MRRILRRWIRKQLNKKGYRVYKPGPYTIFDFESFLYRFLEKYNHLTYVQVGANDGVMNDPLHSFIRKNYNRVKGFHLEPQPDVFNILRSNLEKFDNLKALNLGIHQTDEIIDMFRVKPELLDSLPENAKGIASFKPDHWVKSNLVPNSSFIEKIEVHCVNINDFFKMENIDSLDLLLLDTEGYDYEIIKSIDMIKNKPYIIRFEHGVRNQIMDTDQFYEVCEYLNQHGYQIIAESYDATAYQLNARDLIF